MSFEALASGLRTIVVTEHIPTPDTMEIKARSRLTGATVIGPDCSGIFEPGGAASGMRVLSFKTVALPRKRLALYGRRVPPLPTRRPK